MAENVTVDIQTPSNEVIEGSVIPGDYMIKQVIDEVIDYLGLPRFDEGGAPIEYTLFSLSSQSYLQSSASVAASLRNGDAIRLEAKSNGRVVEVPSAPEGLMPTVTDNPGEVTIILKVLDLNREEQVTLSTMRPVSELMRQIVSNYNLPPRDKLGQVIKYRLRSKALGKFLAETATLGQEGVPTLDRLVLHREEVAGAGRDGEVAGDPTGFSAAITNVLCRRLSSLGLHSFWLNYH